MSSHSPPNYTDGVPVKISEKYKPPPEIHLPTKLIQLSTKCKVPAVAFEDYNFDLEHKILSKTTEWINWRLKEKTERQQRIQQREISRQKRLEAEQKAKLNQVSYPSDDEDFDDEYHDSVVEATKSSGGEAVKSDQVFSPNFNTILMPTQAVNQSTDKKSHRRYASNSSNKIDFSFFESDASPFDNLEIKSMNEMEELAKVLQSSTAVSENQQDSDENTLERNNSSESEPSDHQKNIPTDNNDNDLENAASQKPSIPSYSMHGYNPQQMYANNYYYGMPSYNHQQFGTTNTPTHQFSNSPYHLQNQQQHVPNNCYYTQNYAVNHMTYAAHGLNMSNNNNINMACENSDKSTKSRSVPDLIKELNDELNNSERRRTRNISQSNQKSDEIETTPISSADDELKKLPAKSQALVKQICQMGFNQDMVIRALLRLGDNDKKVVEHLISLNEILQMGFEEERISEALIKFDNNKDQALDYLIS